MTQPTRNLPQLLDALLDCKARCMTAYKNMLPDLTCVVVQHAPDAFMKQNSCHNFRMHVAKWSPGVCVGGVAVCISFFFLPLSCRLPAAPLSALDFCAFCLFVVRCSCMSALIFPTFAALRSSDSLMLATTPRLLFPFRPGGQR